MALNETFTSAACLESDMQPLGSFQIDKKSDIPIWVQIRQRLFYCIVSGELKPGDQLPTMRELAVQLDVNMHTVNKVYRDLEEDGLLEVQVGRGTQVANIANTRFIAFQNEARVSIEEYADNLLKLGMTPEEAVRALAHYLNVSVTINAADTQAISTESAAV